VRKFAYIVNAIFTLAAIICFIVAISDVNSGAGTIVGLIFIFVLIVPGVNFLALAGAGKEKDVFSLYFEQKKLEQQKRINELKKSMGGDI
jgi:hypothetical protein